MSLDLLCMIEYSWLFLGRAKKGWRISSSSENMQGGWTEFFGGAIELFQLGRYIKAFILIGVEIK